MDQETIKIEDLVSEFYDQLNQRNYGQSVKWAYHKVCRQILEWCNKHHFVSFDEKAGNQFCDETIDGHLSKAGSPYHYKRTLRVMRMLVSLQHTGDFEFRSPRIEYKFYTQLGDVIDMYLHYCAVMRKFSATTLSERKRAIFRFDNYLNDNNRTIADITVDLFEDFLTQHCTKHSRRIYKSIFKELYRYLFDNGILYKDYSSLILKEPKVAQASKLPTTYSEEEIRRMIYRKQYCQGRYQR